VYQRLGDLTKEQLLQQQRLEDQEQQQQPLLVMGMADTANAVGFSFLLSVSTGGRKQPALEVAPNCSRQLGRRPLSLKTGWQHMLASSSPH
jgi:hypothetical protein